MIQDNSKPVIFIVYIYLSSKATTHIWKCVMKQLIKVVSADNPKETQLRYARKVTVFGLLKRNGRCRNC